MKKVQYLEIDGCGDSGNIRNVRAAAGNSDWEKLTATVLMATRRGSVCF